MMRGIDFYKYLSSEVILVGSILLYVLLSVAFYEKYPNGFWFLSAFFILLTAEHIYNVIGRNNNSVFSWFKKSILHRFLACFIPAGIVAIIWLFGLGS